MAGAAIAYVIYGGNRSVIWTDVVQMTVIWLGIFVCVGTAVSQLPAGFRLTDALALAQTSGKLRIMDTSWSLSKPYTLWSGLLGGLFLMLSYFGCDQSQVQRYLSGSDLTQSRLSLLFNAFFKIPMQFLVLLTGVLVFVFYHFHAPPLLWNPVELARLEAHAPSGAAKELEDRFGRAFAERRAAAESMAAARHRGASADPETYLRAAGEMGATRAEAVRTLEGLEGGGRYNDTNYIFPSYVVNELPHGLTGLVIAVIFAAAMTALSGELSALATASMVDFYSRFVGRKGSLSELLIARLLTAGWGLFACLVALRAGHLGSAIEVVNTLGSLFYGSILGVFLLALLVREARGAGAFYGLLAGLATVLGVARFTSIHFLWWNLIGASCVVAVGSVISILSPRPEGAPPPG
ncbi:MAG TPA: sodium:solute symporter, partial [Vicinamibacteria bacterium]|jgi:Na+/proline symporter|nr:sodium:solute symporter [Vicinamibacteria bacterium]